MNESQLQQRLRQMAKGRETLEAPPNGEGVSVMTKPQKDIHPSMLQKLTTKITQYTVEITCVFWILNT